MDVVPCTPLKLLYFGIRINFGVQIFALSKKLQSSLIWDGSEVLSFKLDNVSRSFKGFVRGLAGERHGDNLLFIHLVFYK